MSRRKSTAKAKLKATSQQERIHLWKQHFENLLGKHPKVTHEPITKIISNQLDIKLRQFTWEELDSVLIKINNMEDRGIRRCSSDIVMPYMIKTQLTDGQKDASSLSIRRVGPPNRQELPRYNPYINSGEDLQYSTMQLYRTQNWRGCPPGVIVKAMDCGIVVSELVFQSLYYVHFRANTLGKGMNPLILPAIGWIVPLLFF